MCGWELRAGARLSRTSGGSKLCPPREGRGCHSSCFVTLPCPPTPLPHTACMPGYHRRRHGTVQALAVRFLSEEQRDASARRGHGRSLPTVQPPHPRALGNGKRTPTPRRRARCRRPTSDFDTSNTTLFIGGLHRCGVTEDESSQALCSAACGDIIYVKIPAGKVRLRPVRAARGGGTNMAVWAAPDLGAAGNQHLMGPLSAARARRWEGARAPFPAAAFADHVLDSLDTGTGKAGMPVALV